MGTEDKPDIYVQYHDDGTSQWVDLTQKARAFRITDGGLLKIPYATAEFHEFTAMPDPYERFRILANTTGTSYMPFYGRVENRVRQPIAGTVSKLDWRIKAWALEKRLKRDLITWDYSEEQESRDPDTTKKWTFKTMIEDFLTTPDSGYNTNISLDDDNIETWTLITDAVYGKCDFKRQSLTAALRTIAETIGYDGYVWIDGETAKLKFYRIGYLAASPATTLADPFVRKPTREIDAENVLNYILVKGGVDVGFPWDQDKFTEKVMAKYTGVNAVWEPLTTETLSDSSTTKYNETGSPHQSGYSLYIHTLSGDTKVRFRVDRTSLALADIDARFLSIDWFMRADKTAGGANTCTTHIECTDSNNDTIRCGSLKINTAEWTSMNIPTPKDADIADYPPPVWRYTGGSTTFNKSAVKYIDVIIDEYANQSALFIDWWRFTGGRNIDPLENPSAYPSPAVNGAVKDDTSIANYGVRPYWHVDQNIRSFNQAVEEGKRILNVWKDPLETVTVIKKGYEWLRPTQTVTLNSSTLGVSSETWRIRDIGWDWLHGQPLYAVIRLVPQYSKTAPTFAPWNYRPAPTAIPKLPQKLQIPPWV